jgi:serine/threonine-protein kinase RsbT
MHNHGKETDEVANEPPPAELRLDGADFAAEIRVGIESDADVAAARQKGRSLAAELNFSPAEAILIAAVVAELARNIVRHATRGEIRLKVIHGGTAPRGIQVTARDEGPGISDVAEALREGFSTSGSLGVGLPTVRQLVDDFQIDSAENRGTTVTVMKRKRPPCRV